MGVKCGGNRGAGEGVNMEGLSFPEDFLWGTASSAYQTEGNNPHTDWYETELKEQKKSPAKRRIKELCDKACDHWKRFEEDYDLAREMGIQVHRLSVDWGRVFPEEDKPDGYSPGRQTRYTKSERCNGLCWY